LSEILFFTAASPGARGAGLFILLATPPPQCWSIAGQRGRASARLITGFDAPAQNQANMEWIGRSFASRIWRPAICFELLDETVRLRLLAKSERDQSGLALERTGMAANSLATPAGKPEILDDARLEPATQWLRQLIGSRSDPGVGCRREREIF